MSSVHSKEKPSTDLRAEYQMFIGRKMLFLISLILGIIMLAGYAVTQGSADISVMDVYATTTILAKFFPGSFQTTWFSDTNVWGLRLHRILLVIVRGVGLAIAGAVMQGVLKNPWASPFTSGIASAAGFAAIGRRRRGENYPGARDSAGVGKVYAVGSLNELLSDRMTSDVYGVEALVIRSLDKPCVVPLRYLNSDDFTLSLIIFATKTKRNISNDLIILLRYAIRRD